MAFVLRKSITAQWGVLPCLARGAVQRLMFFELAADVGISMNHNAHALIS